MLFAYVAFFSFAYLTVSASTGALILFGAVQLTMFGAGLYAGEQFATIFCHERSIQTEIAEKRNNDLRIEAHSRLMI